MPSCARNFDYLSNKHVRRGTPFRGGGDATCLFIPLDCVATSAAGFALVLDNTTLEIATVIIYEVWCFVSNPGYIPC